MKTKLMVVLGMLTMGCTSVVEERASLLKNGGLEHIDVQTDLPDGWRLAEGTMVRPSTIAASGKYSVEVGGSESGKVLIEADEVAVTAGVLYTFSVAYYQPSGMPYVSGARMEVRWLNAAHTYVQEHLIEGTTQGEWTRLSHRVAAPTGATAAVISIGRTRTPTTVFLDDVLFYAD